MRKERDRTKYDARKRRWKRRPDIGPCPHGESNRLWRMGGDSYQSQLYCRRHKEYINPNGHTCDLCERGKWPRVAATDKGDCPPCGKAKSR